MRYIVERYTRDGVACDDRQLVDAPDGPSAIRHAADDHLAGWVERRLRPGLVALSAPAGGGGDGDYWLALRV